MLLESYTRWPKVYFNLKISVTLLLSLNISKEYTISLSDFYGISLNLKGLQIMIQVNVMGYV